MAATSLRCASHCSHLSLSPSFRCLCIPRTLSPISIYPPAVCTHPLASQRLSRHQCTLTQRTEHRHSSLTTTHPLPLFVHFLTFVCIYPPAVCMHTSSRSQRTDTPLSHGALTSVGPCLSFVEQCTHARTVRTKSPTHNVEHSPAGCAHPFRTDTAH